MPLPKISELSLIAKITKKINPALSSEGPYYRRKGGVKTDSSVACGIGDDAAVLKYTKDRYLLWTCDMLIEGVDFTLKAKPEQIGHKALACSLSDIAAMGGIPRYALISLGLPRSPRMQGQAGQQKGRGLPNQNAQKFIDRFYYGLGKLAREFKVNIVGGDLSFSKRIVVDVSTIGEVNKRRLALRCGAKPNDIVLVSGALGGSIYGKHLKFIPRIKEANYLVNNYQVSAMIDISDGLSLDLYRLCQASKTGAIIYEDLIPVSKDARSFDEALNGGEDFELLFTLPAKAARRLIKNRGAMFKVIGEMREKKFGLRIITKDYKERVLEPKGYQHF